VTNTLPDNLDTLVREAMEEWQVPGLVLAVTRDGEGDWVKAYGLRDVEAGLPVTADTQFILCSVTKSFTALGLAMLVDEGRLDWTKPVRDYLPEFRLHDPFATEHVTTIDLLCHNTGLPRHDWIWMPADISRAEMLTALRYLEPSKDIRAAYQYCNLGYVAAGMVAERISGQTWEDFTRERTAWHGPYPLFGRGPGARRRQCAPLYRARSGEAWRIHASAGSALAGRRYAGGRHQCRSV
jgi:CubicO group peptidase (beta-lactamase class C family)